MNAVLGIDAAWTPHNPSGVALVSRDSGGWSCAAVAPSYEAFINLSNGCAVDWNARHSGSAPRPSNLLDAATTLLNGSRVTLVTVDMPVSNELITGRRRADSEISRRFGRAKCATHSPNKQRPGPIGRDLSEGFSLMGFPLAGSDVPVGMPSRLIEVYPHPALLTLLNFPERHPYKIAKARKFHSHDTIGGILDALQKILSALKREVSQIPLALPDRYSVRTLASLKRYEDAIDALVCAWVGIKYLSGDARPYGDQSAAIWIP